VSREGGREFVLCSACLEGVLGSLGVFCVSGEGGGEFVLYSACLETVVGILCLVFSVHI
jgi:hypothetical protein